MAPRSSAPARSSSTPPSASAGTPRRCSTAAPRRTLVGVDRDLHALELAGARLAPFEGRTTLVHAVYDEIPDVLAELGIAAADGILFDLGVSSMQLDVRERGFAYAEDAPLDMRMDDTEGPTAADVLNTYPAAELARILRTYGEEKFAAPDRPRHRQGPRERAVHRLGPAGRAAPRHHPGAGPAYRRTPGQAHLPGAADRGQRRARRAAPGHPGRDRLDRRRRPGRGDELPLARGPAGQAGLRRRDRPRGCRTTCPSYPAEFEPPLRSLTRGAEKASEAEIDQNPRAASVRLRAVERVNTNVPERGDTAA